MYIYIYTCIHALDSTYVDLQPPSFSIPGRKTWRCVTCCGCVGRSCPSRKKLPRGAAGPADPCGTGMGWERTPRTWDFMVV